MVCFNIRYKNWQISGWCSIIYLVGSNNRWTNALILDIGQPFMTFSYWHEQIQTWVFTLTQQTNKCREGLVSGHVSGSQLSKTPILQNVRLKFHDAETFTWGNFSLSMDWVFLSNVAFLAFSRRCCSIRSLMCGWTNLGVKNLFRLYLLFMCQGIAYSLNRYQ